MGAISKDVPAKGEGKSLLVATGRLGAIKQALNRSGWLSEEVIAAGELRQGKPPSAVGMITGTALIEFARPRRSKALPRHFVLAITTDRVVAFKAWGRDGTPESGPYKVQIMPGERGSWPRASVRLTDLPNGAESDRGTLKLGGRERFPVAMLRDRNTDELIEVLGGDGMTVEAKSSSPKDARESADRESLRRASEARHADYRELAADAVRTQPDIELTDWAARRGLDFRGSVAQGGHLSVTCPWSKGLLFNVVRGPWPGGTYGVLCHEARICEADAPGFFHGGGVVGGQTDDRWTIMDEVNPLFFSPRDFRTTSGRRYFKVPYTAAGTRVPHLATVTGLHVARRAERYTETDKMFGTWSARPMEDLGLDDPWVAAVRKHSHEDTVQRLLQGPVRKLLSTQRPLGFELRIEYGQVIVCQQDFLKHDDDLDAFLADVEAFAAEVRAICVPSAPALLLDTLLDPPAWLEPVRRTPKDKHTLWPIGALLERVMQIADQRGMRVEDPRAFHESFPGLNFPGEAFGVLHGPLPGTALSGRLLCCAERPMALPDEASEFLEDPGGAAGSDVVVLPVSRDVPATPFEGELDGGIRVAVANGALTAWRTRDSWQADGSALDRLAADVAELLLRRGVAMAG
jgi:hypothetical protein